MHKALLIFDIETIPDTKICKNLLGKEFNSTQESREALTKYHLEITDGRNEFLRQPFHKVVAISFIHSTIEKLDNYHEKFKFQEIRSGGSEKSSEKELVQGFFNYIQKHKPRLVTFNGRVFDMPVLKYRAMIHGISSEFLYSSGDKWNNYMQRYSLDWHCDLCEALSDYGTSARVKLNEACSVMGFPGKIGTDGSQVADLYDQNKITEIRDYCELDVLNTYLVYLRLMHHQGKLSEINYAHAIQEIQTLLKQTEKKHLKEFYLAWNESSKYNSQNKQYEIC